MLLSCPVDHPRSVRSEPAPSVPPVNQTAASRSPALDAAVWLADPDSGTERSADHPVLIVEDDEKLARLLARAFDQAGMTTLEVSTGDAALRSVQHGIAIRAAVLDVMIPHPDGLEVCRHLRRLDPLLPLVAISARVGPEHRSRARAAGADAFLGKPFPLSELVRLTRRLIVPLDARAPERS